MTTHRDHEVPARPVTWVAVTGLRYSQNSISGPTRLAGAELTVPDLVSTFRQRGFVSDPIRVVRMPDGGLTSVDNRRLWAAQEAGLTHIAAVVYAPSDPFVAPRQQRRSLRLAKPLVDRLGEMGPVGAALYPEGSSPSTVLDAVLCRCSRQDTHATGGVFPLMGTHERPRYQGEKRPPATPRLPHGPSASRGVGSVPPGGAHDAAGEPASASPSSRTGPVPGGGNASRAAAARRRPGRGFEK